MPPSVAKSDIFWPKNRLPSFARIPGEEQKLKRSSRATNVTCKGTGLLLEVKHMATAHKHLSLPEICWRPGGLLQLKRERSKQCNSSGVRSTNSNTFAFMKPSVPTKQEKSNILTPLLQFQSSGA